MLVPSAGFAMAFAGRITESAAATRTFGALRIERRVLTTPARTIAIANISTVSVGTHATPKPKILYWLLALLFAAMAWGSMRPDFSWGPLSPTGFTFVLGIIMLVFAGLALRPDDKSHYLLISSNDGVLSRFTAPDRAFLDEVRNILTDKINRGDEQMTFSVNFEKVQIENLAAGTEAGGSPAQYANGSGHSANFGNGSGASDERGFVPAAAPRPAKPPRRLASIAQTFKRDRWREARDLRRLHRSPSGHRRNAPVLCAPARHAAPRAALVGTRDADACRNPDAVSEDSRQRIDRRHVADPQCLSASRGTFRPYRRARRLGLAALAPVLNEVRQMREAII